MDSAKQKVFSLCPVIYFPASKYKKSAKFKHRQIDRRENCLDKLDSWYSRNKGEIIKGKRKIVRKKGSKSSLETERKNKKEELRETLQNFFTSKIENERKKRKMN